MINAEAFELIEQRKEEGVTAEYFAKRLGLPKQQAANWLSKWTRRGFLQYIPFDGELERTGWRSRGRPKGGQGKYVLGRKEWGSYAHGKLEERMALREDIKKW